MKNQALFTLFVGLDGIAGQYGPWWLFLVVSFAAGFFARSLRSRTIAFAACLVWLVAAFAHDLPTGFRLSSRIAGVMGFSGSVFVSVFAYVVIGAAAFILAALSAHAGRNLQIASSKARGLRT